ncbi:MBL fold metallo-hydrolase [Deinococcus sp. UYEF24]
MDSVLRTALLAEGLDLKDIRRVLISHHDLDHVGLLTSFSFGKGRPARLLTSE